MFQKAALLTYRDGSLIDHGARVIDLACPDGQVPERIEVFPSKRYKIMTNRNWLSHRRHYDGKLVYLLEHE